MQIHPNSVRICKDALYDKVSSEAPTVRNTADHDLSYEEITARYLHFKKITTKKFINSAHFTVNLKMREHYLSIKKKFDMRRRAKKFREK